MIKIFYPNGMSQEIKRGSKFIISNSMIDIYNVENKLIASFYRMPGMAVFTEEALNDRDV